MALLHYWAVNHGAATFNAVTDSADVATAFGTRSGLQSVWQALSRIINHIVANPGVIIGAAGNLYFSTGRDATSGGNILDSDVTVGAADPGAGDQVVVRANMTAF